MYDTANSRPESTEPSIEFTGTAYTVPTELLPTEDALSGGYSIALYYNRMQTTQGYVATCILFTHELSLILVHVKTT